MPGGAEKLKSQRAALGGNFCGASHSCDQRTIRIRKLHHNSNVICQLLAEAHEFLRLGDGNVRSGGGENLVDAANVGTQGIREQFYLYDGAGADVAEFAIGNKNASFHGVTIGDAAEFITGGEVLAHALVNIRGGDRAVERSANLERIEVSFGY
jgi:hypothetical protein